MGCDIHMHIEVKIGEWEHYAAPKINRNYMLFAKMANVRNHKNEIVPISKPKGLPKDLSIITCLSYIGMKEDAHSMSYLNSEEIGWLSDWLRKVADIEGDFFLDWDLEHSILRTYIEGSRFRLDGNWPKWVQDTRFVFWFDN